MRTKFFRTILVSLLTMALFFTQAGIVLAEGPETEQPIGDPKIALVNGPVFEAEAGKTNQITVKIKNIGGYIAKSVVVQPGVSAEGNPFTISFADGKNRIESIPPRSEREITFNIDVDKTAESKTYELSLRYIYYNTGLKAYEDKDTIYIKIQNASGAPNFVLENIKTDKESISAGESLNMSATIRNIGPVNMYDVQVSLDGLTPEAISVSGLNSKKFDKILAGTQTDIGFTVVSNPDMNSGNYPITIKMTYKDDAGKELEYSQQFFINVGGTSPKEKPTLEIRNMKEPSGTYGVNENFPVSFEILNTGAVAAKNIKVTATPIGETQAVVPKSASIQTTPELAAGKAQAYTFYFAPTSQSKSQNYSVEFLVEYEDGTKKEGVNNIISFKQYIGANVTNPDGDKTEDEKKKESKPKIIVSKYSCDPLIVMAGKEFDLTMTFLNTHPIKTAKNIKMFLTLSEETASNSEKTGNIFTPVDSSNTFYFDSLVPKGTVDKKLRLFVVPDAQPKTYTLTVNFEYEDAEGNEFTAQELLGINVKQVAQLETDDIFVPEMIEMGTPVSVSFNLYNMGKVKLSNLMVSIEGDVQTQSKKTYFGNMDSGNQEYYEGSFSVMKEGEAIVSIIVAYDDASGEHFEEKHDFTMQVTAPLPMDESGFGPEGGMMEPENPMLNNLKVGGIIAAVSIILIILVVILYKKRKAKAEQKFLEMEDLEESELPEQKGNDVDERL